MRAPRIAQLEQTLRCLVISRNAQFENGEAYLSLVSRAEEHEMKILHLNSCELFQVNGRREQVLAFQKKPCMENACRKTRECVQVIQEKSKCIRTS